MNDVETVKLQKELILTSIAKSNAQNLDVKKFFTAEEITKSEYKIDSKTGEVEAKSIFNRKLFEIVSEKELKKPNKKEKRIKYPTKSRSVSYVFETPYFNKDTGEKHTVTFPVDPNSSPESESSSLNGYWLDVSKKPSFKVFQQELATISKTHNDIPIEVIHLNNVI